MPRIPSILTLGLLATLTACPGDDTGTTAGSASGDSTGNSGTTTDNTTPGTTTSDSVDTTAGSATTDPGTTTDTPGTTTDDPGTTTDDPGTSEDSGSSSGGQDACGMCVEDQCADELAACAMDPECTCFQDCAEMNPGIAGALLCADADHCDIPIFELMMTGTPVGDLAVCTQDNCPKCLE